MASILAKFFQLALLLTILLIAINLSIVTFGSTMTGENRFGSQGVITHDLNITDINITQQSVEQTGTAPSTPSASTNVWQEVYDTMYNIGFAYREVIIGTTADIDPSSETDVAQTAGGMIISIIIVLQAVGFAYIPFALWSAFVGGGSP